jgi:hypothetical protein
METPTETCEKDAHGSAPRIAIRMRVRNQRRAFILPAPCRPSFAYPVPTSGARASRSDWRSCTAPAIAQHLRASDTQYVFTHETDIAARLSRNVLQPLGLPEKDTIPENLPGRIFGVCRSGFAVQVS